MIIDCFPYFNEKELLELRIRTLYEHVDMFIITEGSHTHKGERKEFSAKNVIDELGISSGKIKIVPVFMPGQEHEKNPWVRERIQRDAAAFFIQEGDVAFIGDCDEIIDPNMIKHYATVALANQDKILRVPLAYLCCRADLRVYNENGQPVSWNSPFMCSRNHLQKHTLSQIRESHAYSLNNLVFEEIYITCDGIVKDAGWHLTWMGGQERMKLKESYFLHADEVSIQDNYIPQAGKTDLFGRSNHILQHYDTKKLPKQVFENANIRKFLFQEL